MKKLLFLTFFLWSSMQMLWAQKTQSKLYTTPFYQVEYPSYWEKEMKGTDRPMVIFYPKEHFGSITISTYDNFDFDAEMTKRFLMDINRVTEDSSLVKQVGKGDYSEFFFESETDDFYYYTKGLRKSNRLIVVQMVCQKDYLVNEKNTFLKIVYSVRLK